MAWTDLQVEEGVVRAGRPDDRFRNTPERHSVGSGDTGACTLARIDLMWHDGISKSQLNPFPRRSQTKNSRARFDFDLRRCATSVRRRKPARPPGPVAVRARSYDHEGRALAPLLPNSVFHQVPNGPTCVSRDEIETLAAHAATLTRSRFGPTKRTQWGFGQART